MEKTNIYTDEERYWMTGGRTGTLPTRIIPSVIYSLAPNEIFVFGSNALGMHHAGAARVAYNEFGAEWGNGEGLQGQSYSIPTMEGEHNTKLAIMRFTQYAKEHPELKFLVTSLDILQKRLLLCSRMQLIWRMCIYPSASGRC